MTTTERPMLFVTPTKAVDISLVNTLFSDVCRLPNGCLIWLGGVQSAGYGNVWGKGEAKGQQELTHRIAAALWHGTITDGLTVDHDNRVCHPDKNVRRRCVERTHLQLVTRSRNSQMNWGNHPREGYCPKDLHERAEFWHVTPKGAGYCRPCKSAYSKARRIAQKTLGI